MVRDRELYVDIYPLGLLESRLIEYRGRQGSPGVATVPIVFFSIVGSDPMCETVLCTFLLYKKILKLLNQVVSFLRRCLLFLCIILSILKFFFFNRPRREAAARGGYSVVTFHGPLRQVWKVNFENNGKYQFLWLCLITQVHAE